MRVVQKSFVQALHRHETPRLVVFLDGAYVERSFGERAIFGVGDLIIRPHWYAHDGASDGGARYTHLDVSDAGARRFFAQHGWRAWRGRAPVDRLRDLQGDPKGGDALLATARVRPFDQHARDPLHVIARALDSEDHAPLECIAEANGLAPWTLSRRFRHAFGMSPSDFRLQARVQRAMRLMAETDAPIATIAAHAGFTDQSHFTHALKRIVGLTPSSLRRRLALA